VRPDAPFAESSGGTPRTGKPGRLAETVLTAWPPLFPSLAGAVIWGLAMGGSAVAGLLVNDWETPQKIRTVFLLFGFGGAAAFPIGLFLARLLSTARRRDTAFAAAFLSFAIATVAVTAGFFGLQYRSYYAEWHADTFTRIWFLQFAFTVAVALYQFAVLGLRLYFPVGFVALLAVSLWFARRAR
jgi:hypothetical protein